MVTYNPFKNLYKVFGKTLPEKRAKRDGRNPATGAFSSNTASGAVDLTIDVAMVKGVKNVVLPDKKKLREKENSPDNVDTVFNDKVTHVFSYDAENPDESTYTLTDAYSESVDIPYFVDSGNNVVFKLDEIEIVALVDNPTVFCFVSNEITYVHGYCRRNVNGGLLASGQNVENYQPIADVRLGKIFMEYNP